MTAEKKELLHMSPKSNAYPGYAASHREAA
jgi:hypothetical protein